MTKIFLRFKFQLLVFVLAAVADLPAVAQSVSGMLLHSKNHRPGYFELSADGSELIFPDVSSSGVHSLEVLNLKDFSRRTINSFPDKILGADLTSGYSLTTKLNNTGPTVKNFELKYSADGAAANLKPAKTQAIYFGSLPNGNMIGADGSVAYSGQYVRLENLREIQPASGSVIRNLFTGVLIAENEGALSSFRPQYSWLFDEDKTMLVRSGNGKLKVFPFDGKQAYEIPGAVAPVTATKDLLISRTYNDFYISDIHTGRTLYQEKFKSGFDPYYYSVWRADKFYILTTDKKLNKNFTVKSFTGNKLKTETEFALEHDAEWFPSTGNYTLIVSPAAGRIVLLPQFNAVNTKQALTACIWDLNNGKLLHRITPIYEPPPTYVPPKPTMLSEAECKAVIARARFKAGDYVTDDRGSLLKVSNFDCNTSAYMFTSTMTDNKGKRTEYNYPAPDYLTGKHSSVKVTECDKCGGYGALTVTRKYEVVTTGIYNKYTKTGSYQEFEVCSKCKGRGLLKTGQ